MASNVEQIDHAAQILGSRSVQNKSLASHTSIRHPSTTQLINPQYRASRNRIHAPHQYTHTAIPEKGYSPHSLPPHQFTKSRLRTGPPVPTTDIPHQNQSRVEWIPYQRKIVQFKDEPRVEKVERKKIVQDFREEVVYDEVPREYKKIDYYAVEKCRKYVPVQYEERQIIMVEKTVPCKKTIYVPQTRQVFHENVPSNLPVYEDGGCQDPGIRIPSANCQPIGHISRNHVGGCAPGGMIGQPPFVTSQPQPQYRSARHNNFGHHNSFQQSHPQQSYPQHFPQQSHNQSFPQQSHRQPYPQQSHHQPYPPQNQYSSFAHPNSVSQPRQITGTNISRNQTSAINLLQRSRQQTFSNDEYESYVPSFKY